jgi:hypothetical protein
VRRGEARFRALPRVLVHPRHRREAAAQEARRLGDVNRVDQDDLGARGEVAGYPLRGRQGGHAEVHSND